MAREEHDRENLLGEAQALVERASLEVAGYQPEVFVGFRRSGGASFYFGPDRVYHATSAGALRRAFVDGRLYKAEHGRLVALRRRRSADVVELVRHKLNGGEERAFLAEMHRHFDALAKALGRGEFRLVGQVPEGGDVVARIHDWLETFAAQLAIAHSPRVD